MSARCHALVTCSGRKPFFVNRLQASPRAGRIVALDADPLASTRVRCEHSDTVAPVGEGYVDDLLRLAREHGAHCVVPLNDLDLAQLAEGAARLEGAGVRVLGAPLDVVEAVSDKLRTPAWLAGHGLAAPPTATAEEAEALAREHGFPLVAKARRGQGSEGLVRVHAAADLGRVAPGSVVQPLVGGIEHNLDVLRCPERGVVSVVPKRKLRMYGGMTDKALTVDDPGLVELGVRIGDALGHTGGVDVDVMVPEEGDPVVLDINPRLGGGFPCAAFACPGYVDALLAVGLGEPVTPFLGVYRRDVRVYRDAVYFEV